MSAIKYDVVIIGGGPGGYSAALKAAKNGLKTLLVERSKIGGVCLNEGCIPTKTLLYSAKILDSARSGEKYGITAENITIDHAKVVKRKDKVVKILTSGIKSSLEKASVTVLNETATLVKDGVMVGDSIYSAKNVIIATGSSAILPGIKGIEHAITSREALALTEVPKSLTVVGGGVVGLELASYFNSAGAEVTVVEMLPKIGGSLDSELAENLMNLLQKKGIKFMLNARIEEVKSGETVLMAVGRVPNVSEIGLEDIGVKFDNKGIVTNDRCETNVKGIYAIGDVNGKSMLAHTAYREADVCMNNILGREDRVDYATIPSVIYTNPEIAWVGASAEEGEVVKIPMRYSGRYLAENEGGDGICKVVLDKNRRILGVHMAANYASEIIYGAGMLLGVKAEEIEKIVFPHPTVSEIIREALL